MLYNIDLSCFQFNYRAARQRLLADLSHIPGDLLRDHQIFTHPLPGPDGQTLLLDWIRLGQNDTPDSVLVLISGTHGVEGFAGSAIQCHWLSHLAERLTEQPKLGVVIIHALNPWGFAWLRRYDHEGIDLNRNFIDFSAPHPINNKYDQIHNDLFCDTSKQVASTLAYWQSQWGQEEFSAVITRGQYRHADGLFYGGISPSWSRQMLEQACQTIVLQNAQRIAVIDLHTGLGPYGYGEVINDHEPGSPGFEHARRWYGANAQSALLGESCSPPKSGLLDYFWHKFIGDRGCFVTLEYGTYSLDRLLTASCEEQRYHNSYDQAIEQRDINHNSVAALQDFFYPKDQSWQELVLFRAGQVINLALRGILK
jgi:hypothetical protein